jgi:isopenicillin-N N-acyltransferase like protein
MSAQKHGRDLALAHFEPIENFEMLAAGDDDAFVAERPVVVGETSQPVLLLDRHQEVSVSGGGGEAFVEVGVNLEQRDARGVVPRRRQRLLVALAHLRDPGRIEAKGRLEQARGFDELAEPIALGTRDGIAYGGQKMPAMAGLAFDQRHLGQFRENPLQSRPRDAVSTHEIGFGDLLRQVTVEPVARDRDEETIGSARCLRHLDIRNGIGRLCEHVTAVRAAFEDAALRQMRERGTHGRARHLQPLGEGEFGQPRTPPEPVRADELQDAREKVVLQPTRPFGSMVNFLFHVLSKYTTVRALATKDGLMLDPCPLIDVSGPPRERGRQYGKAASDRITRGIGHYSAQLRGLSLDAAAVQGLVREYLPVIERFDAGYVEEMQGIADGAGVPFEDIVLLNARTEILKLGARPDLREKLARSEDPDGCTGVVALPGATAAGRVVHAQNWDWKKECAETAVVLRIRRDDGPDILTFTEAGALARSGFNSAGIAITANYLESDRDYCQVGVPLALIRRKVLEQQHLALAMRAVYVTAKSASNNMIVSHRDGVAIDFECAPDETFQVHPDKGLLVHANHWVSPVALAKLRETGVANTPDSLYRDIRVRDLLTPHLGRITRDEVKNALFDDFASPWSVCRPPRPNLSNNLSATVAMIVMEPALGIMEVALLPALGRRFTTYRLETETARRAAANA